MGNAKSNRAAVVLPAPSGLFDDGGVQERVPSSTFRQAVLAGWVPHERPQPSRG